MKAIGSAGSSRRKRRTLATKSATSVASKALSSESIGVPCRTAEKAAETGAPTRSEGESGRTSIGKRASMAAFLRFSAS